MTRSFQVTFDCAAPAALATFWCEVLGYRPGDPPEGYDSWEDWLMKMEVPKEEWDEGALIVDPDGRGPNISFLQVPESKSVKNRLHLDVDVSGGSLSPIDQRKNEVNAEANRLLALRASKLAEYEQGDHYHVVMQDPEGNEFCLR
jgi:hypothetical protein